MHTILFSLPVLFLLELYLLYLVVQVFLKFLNKKNVVHNNITTETHANTEMFFKLDNIYAGLS